MNNEDFLRLLQSFQPNGLGEWAEPVSDPSEGEREREKPKTSSLSSSSVTPTSLLPFLLGTHTHASSASIYGVLEITQDAQFSRWPCLCVRDIPDVLVPSELLSFLAPAAESIAALKFFRQYDLREREGESERERDTERVGRRYVAVLVVRSTEAALQIQRDYDGVCLSSLHSAVCSVHFVSAAYLVKTSNESEKANGWASASSIENEETEYVTLSDPRALIDDDSLSFSSVGTSSASASAGDEREQCAVCLDFLSHRDDDAIHEEEDDENEEEEKPADAEVVLCCSHRFHWQCFVRLDRPQCPVCRFQHDDCTPQSSLSCSVCQWTARPNGKNSFSPPVANSSYPSSLSFDIHLCLLCGFTGCPEHITQHCRESAHTYALNTADQSVFDFAGEGFVSRLALSLSVEGVEDMDGSSPLPVDGSEFASSSSQRIRTKIAEVNRENGESLSFPSSSSLFRRALPPLTAREEDEFVSHKLEDALAQYNRMLAWRLRENRVFYEQQMQLVRDSVAGTQTRTHISEGEHDATEGEESVEISVSRSLIQNIHSLLNTEKQKLLQQCENVKEKMALALRERDVAQALHTHLTRNKELMEQKLCEQERQYVELERQLSTKVPALESKVQELMCSLDSTTRDTQTRTQGTGTGEDTNS